MPIPIPDGMRDYVRSYWGHYTALPETFTDDGGTTYNWKVIWNTFIDNNEFDLDVGAHRKQFTTPENYTWRNDALPS